MGLTIGKDYSVKAREGVGSMMKRSGQEPSKLEKTVLMRRWGLGRVNGKDYAYEELGSRCQMIEKKKN